MDDEIRGVLGNLGEHLKDFAEQQKRHDGLAMQYMQTIKQRVKATSSDKPIVALIKLSNEGMEVSHTNQPDLAMFAVVIHMAFLSKAVNEQLKGEYPDLSDCCRHALMAGLFECGVKNGEIQAATEKESTNNEKS